MEMDSGERFIVPPVNVRETADQIIVEAEMPGIDKNRLEIMLKEKDLFILGRRAKEEPSMGDPVWQEIPHYDFRRVFALGDHVNRSSIHASFDNGVLTLRIAKAEEAKPKKIEVAFA